MRLYNYLLRVLPNNAPPFKRIVPNPLYAYALIKPYKNLNKEKKILEGKERFNFAHREIGGIYARREDVKEL